LEQRLPPGQNNHRNAKHLKEVVRERESGGLLVAEQVLEEGIIIGIIDDVVRVGESGLLVADEVLEEGIIEVIGRVGVRGVVEKRVHEVVVVKTAEAAEAEAGLDRAAHQRGTGGGAGGSRVVGRGAVQAAEERQLRHGGQAGAERQARAEKAVEAGAAEG
jgi:hypothetical protein